jgi:cobalt-zinc-cadmium resistance protein CzcA
MSLGAIDFGLIVDGAVIIVENAVRRLGEQQRASSSPLSDSERSQVVEEAALEVRSASVFGELIIAIVYLPIVVLRGLEGKMFQPMALTVLFAIGGAFVFSLTLVPVLASYFLRAKSEGHTETWLMRRAHALYGPVLRATMRRRSIALSGGLVILVLGIGVATKLGAEFVPQFDEGDLLLEVRRMPGISLTESLAIDRRVQRAALTVPEIERAIGRIGAPEVANDPMGLEESDIYLLLKPRDAWRRDVDKAAIANQLSEAVARDVPEAAIAISQPIQMRVNELVAGVRSDVGVQLYGPDLDVLQQLSDKIALQLRRVPGAVDVRPPQGGGLSYLRVIPDRARLARYGLTVEDVNILVETIAVGRSAGVIFERDRRFALVVKTGQVTGNLETVRALPLKASTGQMVPLGDVAEVKLEPGPSLVNRQQQARRAVVEFNVRGRDMVAVVDEAKARIDREVPRPVGYRLEWGGQFEHYLSARTRLAVIVPVALAMILFLLWLAFRAVLPAVLIFVNIPFAATGGVFALWLRGIPFSISAGVGFIALFGVAVLNGLVLVSFARHREVEGGSASESIAGAAEHRLRPVLMTALVAALGFLPMALSTAPGSEVQRPLATVVIGGLATATALTLLLFPAVYSVAHRRRGATHGA